MNERLAHNPRHARRRTAKFNFYRADRVAGRGALCLIKKALKVQGFCGFAAGFPLSRACRQVV